VAYGQRSSAVIVISQSALNLERRLRCCQKKSHCRVHRYCCSGSYRLRNSGGGQDGAADKPLAHEHWLVAFANILFQKETLTPGELAKKNGRSSDAVFGRNDTLQLT
jgi:hypothetical protein